MKNFKIKLGNNNFQHAILRFLNKKIFFISKFSLLGKFKPPVSLNIPKSYLEENLPLPFPQRSLKILKKQEILLSKKASEKYEIKKTLETKEKILASIKKAKTWKALSKHFTIVFLLLPCLTGCNVGPNYQTPKPQMPLEFYETQEKSYGEDGDLISWWNQFNDPLLNQFIEEALQENLDLQLALEKIQEQRARYRLKLAELFPTVDLSGVQRRARISQSLFDSTFLGPPIQNLYQIGFDANWEIDFFGKLKREKESAFYAFESEIENARNIYITMISEIAKTYVEIRSLQNQVDLIKQIIEIDAHLTHLTQHLFEAGLASEIAWQTTLSQLEESRSSLPPMEALLKQQIHALAFLLNKTPENFDNALEEITPIPYSTQKIPIGLPSDLLRRRPDIRQAERNLASATAAIGAAIADYFPRFSLIGSMGFDSNRTSSLFSKSSHVWEIGPSIKWPILYFGRIRENIRAQNSVQEQALLIYEKTLLNALINVEDALVNFYQEEKKHFFLVQEVKIKERTYRLNQDLTQSGLQNLQVTLTTHRDFLKAKNNLLKSRQNQAINLIALYKALGGDWLCSY